MTDNEMSETGTSRDGSDSRTPRDRGESGDATFRGNRGQPDAGHWLVIWLCGAVFVTVVKFASVLTDTTPSLSPLAIAVLVLWWTIPALIIYNRYGKGGQDA